MSKEKDTLFKDQPSVAEGSFQFNEPVVKVFPDMIERSVPGYRELLELTPLIVKQAVGANELVYDLGCSLGAATLAARRAIQAPGARIIGLDSSAQMVERCRAIVAEDNSSVPVEIHQADITQSPFEPASLFLMYFTLQFIPPTERPALLRRIGDALKPGGVLLLAEKLSFDSHHEQTWMDEHHLAFKRAQGYSDLEIANKRQAIENVLIPESEQAHIKALETAGFSRVYRWFQSLNFACFVAIK